MEQFFNPIIEEIESRLTKLGLYLSNVEAGAVPVSEDVSKEIIDGADPEQMIMDESKISLYLTSVFNISDLAWSDRVINPSSYEEEKQFKMIAPTEFEISFESFKDEILNWDDD
jgi:hypothetical protein